MGKSQEKGLGKPRPWHPGYAAIYDLTSVYDAYANALSDLRKSFLFLVSLLLTKTLLAEMFDN